MADSRAASPSAWDWTINPSWVRTSLVVMTFVVAFVVVVFVVFGLLDGCWIVVEKGILFTKSTVEADNNTQLQCNNTTMKCNAMVPLMPVQIRPSFKCFFNIIPDVLINCRM